MTEQEMTLRSIQVYKKKLRKIETELCAAAWKLKTQGLQ